MPTLDLQQLAQGETSASGCAHFDFLLTDKGVSYAFNSLALGQIFRPSLKFVQVCSRVARFFVV
jgi:hypothetical protein